MEVVIALITAVAVALISAGATLLVAIVAGALGVLGGILLERQKSQEWARKERWTFKKSIYEDAFQAIASARLASAIWKKNSDSASAEEAQKAFRKLSLLFNRIEAFCDEPAAAAIEKFHDRFRRLSELSEKARDSEIITTQIDVLRELEVALQKEARKDFTEL